MFAAFNGGKVCIRESKGSAKSLSMDMANNITFIQSECTAPSMEDDKSLVEVVELFPD